MKKRNRDENDVVNEKQVEMSFELKTKRKTKFRTKIDTINEEFSLRMNNHV